MADVITRLKIESGEYDSKIKRAVSGLQNMEQECRRVGGTLAILEKDQKQYIQSLGQMQTVSNTVRGKIGELTSAYVELSSQYKRLTEEEKKGDFGKALSSSLEQIKQRINDSKKELSDIQKELNATGNESNSTGSVLDQLSQKFTINFDAVKLFNTALKAADGAMQVAKDAFFASEATVDEWGRTVEASRSLYDGFLTALNNSDISGYLTRMDQIVEAARKAYDELDRLGTMKTIQGPAISAQQTENDRMRQMIMTGRYIAPVDGRNAAPGMVNGQRLTADQIRAIERNLQGGMQKIVTLVGNEVKQTSKAIDARYSLMAKENGLTLKEFRQGTSSMAEFDKRIKAAAEYEKYERAHTTITTRINPTSGDAETVMLRDNTKNPYESAKNWATFRVDKMGQGSYNDLVNLIRQRDQQAAQAYGMQSQAYRSINRAEGTTVRDIMNGKTGGTGGGTTTKGNTPADDIAKAEANYAATMNMAQRDLMENVITQKKYDETIFKGQQDLANAYNKAYEATGDEKYLKAYQETAAHVTEMQGVIDSNIEAQKESEKAARELANAQKKLTDAQNELADAQASGDLKKIYAAEKKVETAQVQVNARTSTPTGEQKAVEVPITISNLDALKQHLTEEIATTPVGDSLLQNMQEAFSDASAIGTILQTAVKNGIDTATFDTSGIMQKLLNGEDISDETIQGFVQTLNEKLVEAFGEDGAAKLKVVFDVDDKQIKNLGKKTTEDAEKTQKAWGLAATSVNNLGNALAGIEDPGAKAAGTVLKAIADIALGFANASKTASGLGPWGWLAWMAAGTAAMATTISTVHSLTGFAEGGVVEGNTYSGDQIPAMLNAGEVVLTRSQAASLAETLEDSERGGGFGGTPYVTGEQIYLGLNNYLKGAGLGQIVTSNS